MFERAISTTYHALNGVRGERMTPVQRGLVVLIVASATTAIVGTEPLVQEAGGDTLALLDDLFFVAFSVEYILRVWSAGIDPRFAGVRGRLRYVLQPVAVLDFLALVPYALGFIGSEAFLLRLARLIRLFALARLTRFSDAARRIGASLAARRYELGVTLLIGAILLLTSATVLYVVEGGDQPATFGSIPRALWWSVSTLTTVGYGDVIPRSPLGKFFAAITAIAGIGLIAMPTGILAAAFSEALRKPAAETTQGKD